MKDEQRTREWTFIVMNGYKIIYASFFVSLFFAGYAAIQYFSEAELILGIWSLFSIFLFPKVIFGLILISTRDMILFSNLPLIIRKVFPRTSRRYHPDSISNPYIEYAKTKGYIRESVWLIICLTPVIVFFYRD